MDLLLKLRVATVRLLMYLNERAERKQEPQPPKPSFTETIRSSSTHGKVLLQFYTPSTFGSGKGENPGKVKHPVVIAFHGGGLIAGSPSMDARWISTALGTETQPVVVGVHYGLAPENSFPGPVQDAVAAISWVANNGAEKYGLDSKRIVLVGFSGGGTLTLAAPLWMEAYGTKLPHPVRGLVSIYPGLDYRIPREPASSMIARFMNNTWDDAYFRQSPLASPFLSPAAADDQSLKAALPTRVALYPVAKDHLLGPAEELRQRLIGLGKHVTGDVEPDAIHAWDKYPIRRDNAAKWQKREEWFKRITADVESMLKE